MKNIFKLTLIITMFIISSCNNEESVEKQESLTEGVTVNQTYNFEDIIQKLASDYKNKNIVVALQVEFINDKLKVLKKSEIEGFAATLLLSSYNYNNSSGFAKTSGGKCSSKDKANGDCYSVTCISNGKSTKSECTGGAFGSCIGIVKNCFKDGGCIEA